MEITRRCFTGSVLAACTAGTVRADCYTPALYGVLHRDELTRAAFARDEGGIVQRRPYAVLEPRAEADIQNLVHFAHHHQRRVVARGQGHQPFGQAQTEQLLIDMRSLHAVHELREGELTVDAGASWQSVIDAALASGQAPPVLTNFTGLSVGGTLAVGGLGLSSSEHGAQVDCVRALRVITGDGSALDCSDELLEAMLAGQGQCGVISRATLKLVPAPATVRETMLQFDDVHTLLAALAGSSVGLIARIPSGWSFTLQALGVPPSGRVIQSRELPYASYARGTPYQPTGRPAPSLGLLLPAASAPDFLARALSELTPEALGAATALRVFCWPRERFARPLLRMPSADRVVYAAILRNEPGDLARMLAGNRTLYEQAREVGGTLYPFAALALSRDEWRQHYGDAWPLLVAAKRRYDPGNVFASGPDIF